MGYEVDFLAVGDGERSGDAIALRFGDLYGDRSRQTVVVIDGGFQDSGEKLAEHIAKYYKTDSVDIAVSTHPDADHVGGLAVILDKLNVASLWMHLPWKHANNIEGMFLEGKIMTASNIRAELKESLESVRALDAKAREKGIAVIEPFVGVFETTRSFYVLGPTKDFYETVLPGFIIPAAAQVEGVIRRVAEKAKDFITSIAEDWGYESLDDSGETSAENNSSVILLLLCDADAVLFTADAGIPALTQAADRLDSIAFDYSALRLVQVPHHGSKRNVGPALLDRILGPKLPEDVDRRIAYASCSIGGSPKHPAKKVANAFRRRGARVYVTQGRNIWYHHNAPRRADYSSISPLPFYSEVEE